jgi:hypothetical protein
MKLMFSQEQVMNILAQYAADKGMLNHKLSEPNKLLSIKLTVEVENEVYFELEVTDAKDQ